MKSRVIYTCEICYRDYPTIKEAESCESQAVIKEEWQKIGEETGFYGFGESGVVGPEKLTYCGLNKKHQSIYSGMQLSHKQTIDYVTNVDYTVNIDWLSPYGGCDFLLYVEEDELKRELQKWKEACNYYGLKPDIKKCRWIESYMWKFYEENLSYEEMKQKAINYYENFT
jgi:hypothetical protein